MLAIVPLVLLHIRHKVILFLVVLEVVPALFNCAPGKAFCDLREVLSILDEARNVQVLFLGRPLVRARVRSLVAQGRVTIVSGRCRLDLKLLLSRAD